MSDANANPAPSPSLAASIASEIRQLAARQAAELVQLAREAAEQSIHDGKTRAAEQLAAVGGAVRRAADKLYDQNNDALAEYVDGAAERVESVARHIDEHDLAELAGDVRTMARRKPALFLGGLFVAGLASAQLLRAMNKRAATATPPTPPPAPAPDGRADRLLP